MGLFDFFSNKPTPAKINKITSRMLNEHQQQQIRQEAMEELTAFGTPEAIKALVKRLGVNFRDTIKNEQEKRWVADVLVERFGPDAVEPMISFINEENSVSSVIMTLGRLIPEDRMVSLLLDSLIQFPPHDHRTVQKRLQLVDALADHEHETVAPAIIPYLMDHDDDIRIKVMDILDGRIQRNGTNYPALLEGLISVLKDPHAGGRITRRAARMLSGLNADLSKRLEELDGFVPDGYILGTNGRLSGQ